MPRPIRSPRPALPRPAGMAYLYFAIICVLFGSNFVLMDRATLVLEPGTVALARLWGGAAALAVVWWYSRVRASMDLKTFGRLLAVAVLANSYPFVLQPWLLKQGVDHSFLAVFVPFTPLMTIVASVPMLGIRPTWQQTVGVLGGLVLLIWIGGDADAHHLSLWMLPVVLTMPLSYAIGNTYMRQHLQHVPSIVVSTSLLLLGGVSLLPLAGYELWNTPPQATVKEWRMLMVVLVLLGPLGTGVCIGLFVRLVQDQGPLFAGMVTYVVPVVALAWGYYDGETISTGQVAGIAGILAMVALVQSSQPDYSAIKTAKR